MVAHRSTATRTPPVRTVSTVEPAAASSRSATLSTGCQRASQPKIPRKQVRAAVAIVVTAVAIVGVLSQAGGFLVIHNANSSDLIIVLGGNEDFCVEPGLQLLKSGLAQRMLVDVNASQHWFGVTKADRLRSSLALVPGIGSRVSVCPTTADSTLEETKDVERCLQGFPARRILILTSAFHTRRALSTFRHALPQYDWSVVPVYDPGSFGVPWWRHRAWIATTIHEWEKLVWWEAVERWTT